MPEIKSHRTIKTIPMARKLGAPIFRRKSEKYSTVSTCLVFYIDGDGGVNPFRKKGDGCCSNRSGTYEAIR